MPGAREQNGAMLMLESRGLHIGLIFLLFLLPPLISQTQHHRIYALTGTPPSVSPTDEYPTVPERPYLALGTILGTFFLLWVFYRRYPNPLPRLYTRAVSQRQPPPDHSPGGARYFLLRSYDLRCWLADMGDLWERGLITISKESDNKAYRWYFRPQVKEPPSDLPASEALLWKGYFASGKTLRTSFSELSRDFPFWDVIHDHERLLQKIYGHYYLRRPVVTVAVTSIISLIAGVFALFFAGGWLTLPILILWVGCQFMPYAYRHKLAQYQPEGETLFVQLAGLKLGFPHLPPEPPSTPPSPTGSFGWAVAFEEETGWWAKVALEADYAWNLRKIRIREMDVIYEAQKGYAEKQVGRILSSRLGPQWKRKNPQPPRF